MTMKIKMKYSVLSLLTAAALGACAVPQHSPMPVVNANPISISESIERLELYSRPNGMSLSARDQDAVAEFLMAYGQYGDGPVFMNVPGSQSGSIGTRQSTELVRQTMAQVGLGVGALQTGQYQSNSSAPAPVVVSYRRLKIVPKDCRSLGDITSSHSNQPMPDFGCAHHANLGAMIQDPRQLLEPYALDVPNAMRRRTVYDKYIEGENPASVHPDRQENRTDE